MSSYIVSYDLKGATPTQYETVAERIKSIGAWGKVLESTWVVVSDKSAIEIRDHISSVLSSNDRLLVVESNHEAAWFNAICKNKWLVDNI